MISSGAWTMLNLYLVISVCAVVFDLIVMLRENYKQSRQEKRVQEMKIFLQQEFENIRSGKTVSDKGRIKLYKRLKSTGYLLAFSDTAEEYSSSEPCFAELLDQTGDVFLKLVHVYRRRDIMLRASYAWALSRCSHEIPAVYGFLADCVLEQKSIYCRENALIAIYRGGNANRVATALKLMSRQEIKHSEKLLSDGLLTFAGDKNELAALLWESFDELSPYIQTSVIDFVKQISGDYKAEFMVILENEATDDELCYSILRYFGKMKYEPACQLMLSLLVRPRHGMWEYAAVSASCLGSYHTDQVVEALKISLGSNNWYVRYNSAESLIAMKLDKSVYDSILTGRDRFAREIFSYMSSRDEMQKEKNTKQKEGAKALGIS